MPVYDPSPGYRARDDIERFWRGDGWVPPPVPLDRPEQAGFDHLQDALNHFADELASAQQLLEPDFRAVLDENYWALIADDE